MTTKSLTQKPSEVLLPARMSLNLNALNEVRFATLEFPYQKALYTFLERLTSEYNAKYHRDGKSQSLPYHLRPPFRQLNLAIMACCPVLVHAFEKYGETLYMVAINRLERDLQTNAIIDMGDQYPEIELLTDLIDLWIDKWLEDTGLKALVDDAMKLDLDLLKAALKSPEMQWVTNVTLDDLIAQLNQDNPLGFNVIPAAIMALLHGQTMTLTPVEGNPIAITWRKAHNGGAKGLHLVSQPFHPQYLVNKYQWQGISVDKDETLKDGYFVYRLDVTLQTQVGHIDHNRSAPWIFLKVGMRRYAHEPFASDSQRRNLSVLLGFNREKILPENRDKFARYPQDTTLIALPISTKYPSKKKVWNSHLAELLSSYGISMLAEPVAVLADPAHYTNLDNRDKFPDNEYYVIHAEGRTYSSNGRKRGHKHNVNVGFSLKERTEVIQRILGLLPDVLIPDDPFEPDIQAPKGRYAPLALRSYNNFRPNKNHTSEKTANRIKATIDAIQRAVCAAGKDGLDIALVHHDTDFVQAVKDELGRMFPSSEIDESPFIQWHEVLVSAIDISRLDEGDLDPYDRFKSAHLRPKNFDKNWDRQMQEQRQKKLGDWRSRLSRIAWRDNTHHVALIEAYYNVKNFRAIHESQTIKGVIREACCREGIASQFIGHFQTQAGKKLRAEHAGRLENSLLDLLLRGTGAMYGTPADLYERAAGLSQEIAYTLDVVTFWHVQKFPSQGAPFTTVIATRLRPDGCMEVIAPEMTNWIPYAQASVELGVTFANLRSKLRNNQSNKNGLNILRLKNSDVMAFVQTVLRYHLSAPTIAVIPASWWRNAKGKYDDMMRWPQLGNKRLFTAQHTLDFLHLRGGEKIQRADAHYENLLAVIRLRMDSETPQYTVGTLTWDANQQTSDAAHLSGYVDCTVKTPMHYFSVAGQSTFQKKQGSKAFKDRYKLYLASDYGYRHAQLLELLPFFVRDDFRDEESLKVLCRCIHFLRVSPAFSAGNILLPYPMHLAKALLNDVLDIVEDI